MSGIRKLVPVWQQARAGLLTLGGLGSLAASAWTAWGVAPGLAATGAALLVVEYLTGDESGARR